MTLHTLVVTDESALEHRVRPYIHEFGQLLIQLFRLGSLFVIDFGKALRTSEVFDDVTLVPL